jgi:FKBP-type peptidyl-prolyl cis-trans isomerase
MFFIVQYSGTLENGTEFDSSSGGYPFTFELGNGVCSRGMERVGELSERNRGVKANERRRREERRSGRKERGEKKRKEGERREEAEGRGEEKKEERKEGEEKRRRECERKVEIIISHVHRRSYSGVG